MRIDRSAIKQNAKNQMRASKPHACLVALIYLLIINVLTLLSNKIQGFGMADFTRYMEGLNSGVLPYMPQISFLGSLITLALSIVSLIISTGFVIYALQISRLQAAGFGTIFEGFSIFLRAIWLSILTGIFVFLWSLLLIIPGIIAAYRYRLALYIMIDNPQLSVLDCIRESKRLMKGRKWELFVLDLSFIGWYILCIVPFVSIWVTPYTEVTYANYYMAVAGLEIGSNNVEDQNSDDQTSPPWEI